jgi:diguanylate cyclase (GGDEF)-like protein
LFSSYKHHILIVEDDILTSSMIAEALSRYCTVNVVETGQAALEHCENNLPDLILMDIEMPTIDGLTACKMLKEQESTQYIPVVIITAHTELVYEDMSWEAGCADFVAKPFSIVALRHRVNHHLQVKLLTDKFKKMASVDGLTGLQNRHAFDLELTKQIRLSQRMQLPLGLIMIDIDFFKEYNDVYGHLGGDQCLQQIAEIMVEILVRPADMLARYGGEEFVVILPGTGIKGVKHIADKLLKAVQDLGRAHRGSPFEILTICIGGTSFSPPDIQEYDLIAKADSLLYEAKNNGRNRVVVSK